MVEKSFIYSYVRVAWLIVLGMALLFIDFFSKAYVYNILPYYGTCREVEGIGFAVFYNFLGIDFFIHLATNKGAAWGFFANFQWILLMVRVLAIFAIFIYLFFFNRNPWFNVPFIFIAAGAIGNVIDFFLYGFVIDFLHFNLWGYHFPIFNFADTCITLGVIWLFLLTLLVPKKHHA